MTEQQFDERLKQIEVECGRRRDAVDAYRDQELARLFEECEWSQEKMAHRMGKTKSWVSKRLTFRRFLTAFPEWKHDLSFLTEGAFRHYWAKTKGTESERFRDVREALAGCDLPSRPEVLTTKPNYVHGVREVLADGRWHPRDGILADLEEKYPEATAASLEAALGNARRPHKGKTLESKGKADGLQYRLVEAPDDPAQVAAQALYDQLEPHLEQLQSMSKRPQATLAPVEIAIIAARIRRLVEAACGMGAVSG